MEYRIETLYTYTHLLIAQMLLFHYYVFRFELKLFIQCKRARKRNFGHNHADSPNTMAIENLKQIKATLETMIFQVALEKKVPIFGKIKRLVVPCLWLYI